MSRPGWADPFTVSVDGLLIGVRTTPALDEALRASLASMTVDAPAPPNYSLLPAEDAKGFHFLYRGGCTAVRTRDADRLLRGLARHLVGHRQPRPGTMRTNAVAVVRAGGDAVLLPDVRADLARLERRLRQAGSTILDDPWTDIDPLDGAVVVPEAEPVIEASLRPVRALLGEGPTEQVVAPGRYPLTAWFLPHPAGDGRELRRAEAVHLACSAASGDHVRLGASATIAMLGQVFTRIDGFAVAAHAGPVHVHAVLDATLALPPARQMQ